MASLINLLRQKKKAKEDSNGTGTGGLRSGQATQIERKIQRMAATIKGPVKW
jgi:hypothetical protein